MSRRQARSAEMQPSFEQNKFDRFLTDEDAANFSIPDFSPAQLSPPVYFIDFESGRRPSSWRAGTSKAFPAIGQLRAGGSSAKAEHLNPAKEGVPGTTIFESRADSPPQRSTALGGLRSQAPAAGRTPLSVGRPAETARRKLLVVLPRRAGPFLLGAVQFAAVCLVWAIWAFVIFVLLIMSTGIGR